MKRKSKLKKKSKKQKQNKTARSKKIMAQLTLESSYNAAMVTAPYANIFGEQSLLNLADELAEKNNQINNGDLSCAESMLFNQAHALQTIFANLSRRAIDSEYMENFERYLRLALKAQAQCTRSLEVLGMLKNPASISLVKQANIGQAVQVNNNLSPPTPTIPHARENLNLENKLLEVNNAQRLDTRTTNPTINAYSQLESVE